MAKIGGSLKGVRETEFNGAGGSEQGWGNMANDLRYTVWDETGGDEVGEPRTATKRPAPRGSKHLSPKPYALSSEP